LKFFFALLFILSLSVGITSNAHAYCADKLTQEHTTDSTLFTFSFDQIDQWAMDRQLSFDSQDLQSANSALIYLYESLYCQAVPVVDMENSDCSQVKAGRWFSTQCYLETDDGYFFVHQDLLDQVHLHFHRWD
jgi:hypothetical protein